jgi:hypothetical protein
MVLFSSFDHHLSRTHLTANWEKEKPQESRRPAGKKKLFHPLGFCVCFAI